MANYLDEHRWPFWIVAIALTALLLWMRGRGWLPQSTWKFTLAVVVVIGGAVGVGIAAAVDGALGGRNERPDGVTSRVGHWDSVYAFAGSGSLPPGAEKLGSTRGGGVLYGPSRASGRVPSVWVTLAGKTWRYKFETAIE